jgi:hypothetical protein
VGAPRDAAPLELVQIAPSRHRRDAEGRLDLCDGDRPGREQQIGDQPATILRDRVIRRGGVRVGGIFARVRFCAVGDRLADGRAAILVGAVRAA